MVREYNISEKNPRSKRMNLKGTSCNVGKVRGMYILDLAILGDGFSVLLASFVARNKQNDITEQLN